MIDLTYFVIPSFILSILICSFSGVLILSTGIVLDSSLDILVGLTLLMFLAIVMIELYYTYKEFEREEGKG